VTELLDSFFHRFNRPARERLGHIPNSAPNQALGRLRIGFTKAAHPARYFWKQVSGVKLQIILV
jgi:hypothetical protein